MLWELQAAVVVRWGQCSGLCHTCVTACAVMLIGAGRRSVWAGPPPCKDLHTPCCEETGSDQVPSTGVAVPAPTPRQRAERQCSELLRETPDTPPPLPFCGRRTGSHGVCAHARPCLAAPPPLPRRIPATASPHPRHPPPAARATAQGAGWGRWPDTRRWTGGLWQDRVLPRGSQRLHGTCHGCRHPSVPGQRRQGTLSGCAMPRVCHPHPVRDSVRMGLT